LTAAYDVGASTFDFDRDIYGHREVKAVLLKMQHNKCAFCEAKPLHVSSGDIEHFRPKAAVNDGVNVLRPGYYWLAYEWTNLLFACEACNRRNKGCLFPLTEPSRRARSHHDPITDEAPLFINPCDDEPSIHIGFREHVPYAKTERGRATIDALGLARPELNADREEKFATLQSLQRLLALETEPTVRQKIQTLLAANQSAAGEYAAMVRASVAQGQERE
jgi:uncharacterized protein (TIGR02646 family)